MLVVHKYGGSSVSSTQKIKSIAEHLKNLHEQGVDIVVVVSAMGKTTNNLIALANEITNMPNKREMDVLMATGEMQSISLLSIALNSLGVKAVSMSGMQAGFLTTDNFGHAFIRSVDVTRIKEHLSNHEIVVVAGFQGVTDQLETTTFGRGGSDTTAAALAASLSCDCEIYTDVEAVCSVDPNYLPSPKRLHRICYEEMMEMAVSGAKVLEPRCVELAKKYNVKLYLGKTLESDKTKGTWVMKDSDLERMLVKSLSIKTDYNTVVFTLPRSSDLWSKVYAVCRGLTNYEMLSSILWKDKVIFAFGVTKPYYNEVVEKIQKEFDTDILELLSKGMLEIQTDLTRLTLVGIGLSTHTNIAGVVDDVLRREGIVYGYVSNTEISHSITIENKDVEKAVEVLSKKFNLQGEI